MKIQGFLISYPKFDLFSHTQLRFLSNHRTEIFDNPNSHMKLQQKLNNIGCLKDVLRLYDEMKRIRPLPSVIQFTQLLSRLVKLEEYSAAVRLYRYFCCLRIPNNAYTMNIAVNCDCHLNRIDFGFSILGSLFKRGFVPNSFTYTALLKGLFGENRRDEALELFKKIVRDRLCELDVVVYGVVIDGLCKAGGVEPAMELLRIMEKESCKPNTHIYSMIIDAFCKDKQVDFALKLFDEMSGKGINPFTYTALLKGLFGENRRDEALELFEKIVREKLCELDVVVYGVVIDGLCTAGGVEPAMELLRIMEKGSCKPNTHIYSMVIDALCKDKQVDSALKLFDEMSEKGINPFTYTALLKGLFGENRGDEALELFEKIKREKLCELNVVVYGVVIDGLCKAGGVAAAMELLRIMEKGSCKPNTHIYSMVIDALCKDKQVDFALKLFDEMSEKGISPNVFTYNILIHGMCSLNRWEEVDILLKQMVKLKVHPDVVTFGSLMDALCNQGRLDDARKVFDSMADKGIAPNIQSINILIDGYCKNMRIKEAMQLFKETKRKGLEPNLVTYSVKRKA